MGKRLMEKLDGMSLDNVHERIEELKRLFPEAVKEGRLDYDTLMVLLGDEFDDDSEKYQFTWKGKLDSLKLAQKRSNGTLRPDFEESRDWESTGNLFLEGDNLEVLKLLQQGYLRKVKMIYIDPPYNTGNDFVYEDDFSDPIAKYKEATGQSMRANPETAGRYHSKWLSMMYPRLKIAKTLLRDDGVMFISIDDNEQANLKKICDEIFGEENFVATVIWQKVYSPKNSAKHFSEDHDFILVYARNAEDWRPKLLPRTDEMTARYNNLDNDQRGPWKAGDLSARNYYGAGTYSITCPSGRVIDSPPTGTYWRVSEEKFKELDADNRIWWGENQDNVPAIKRFLSEVQAGVVPQTLWGYKAVGHTQEAKKDLISLVEFRSSDDVFDTPKPSRLIQQMLRIATQSSDKDIILDFFAGSGTTAQAVLQLNQEDNGNRSFIVVQLPESLNSSNSSNYRTIADVSKERIRRAGEKIMNEWQEQQKGQLALGENAEPSSPPDIGFKVFKLDSSNLQTWDDSYVLPEQADIFQQRMQQHIDAFKPDRRAIDVVYEIFLKYGVPLTEKLSTLEIQDKTFYVVGENGYLFICLDEGITVEIVETAIKYAPGTIIFSDECFANDNDITNASMIMEKAHVEFRWI